MKYLAKSLLTAAAMLITTSLFAQVDLNFNNIHPTSEGAIILSWNSNSNEVYEIDYADALDTNSDGTTAWAALYTDYPSQGSNTFIADAGNYDDSPAIPHPRLSPMRYYRIILTSTNTSPTNPTVAVIFPTNGASLSGDVTMMVSASSPEVLCETKLYIDGEEQWLSDDGTNFLINTCEWPNGPHTIFATAKSASTIEGFPFGNPATFGRTVSSFVNVTFNNLITRFDFSQPFFEPSLGQTQNITAAFTANVDWTLEIQDINSNDVLYVTGSGTNMAYSWDGTGTNEQSIPDGVYSYLLTVQTNGQSESQVSGGDLGGSPPSPSFASASLVQARAPTQLLVATGDGSGNVVPFVIYPPGFDTNGLDIFEGSLANFQAVGASVQTASFGAHNSSGASPDGFTLSPQSTRSPKRKPKVKIKNASGTIGICYKTYPNGATAHEPTTGYPPPLQVYVAVDSFPAMTGTINFDSLNEFAYAQMTGFQQGMKIGGYKPQFVKVDDAWSASDIQSAALGGNSIFNTCNFGLLLTHGVYGTTAEDNGVKYTYFLLHNEKTSTSRYVRLSDLDLGSTGTNGLRWMTIFSCNALHPSDITSMANNSLLPNNENLHLLLGASTYSYCDPFLGIIYASNMVVNLQNIPNAWVNAGQQAYAGALQRSAAARIGMTNKVSFRTMGQNNNLSDTIYIYSDPDFNQAFQIIDTTVFTPQ